MGKFKNKKSFTEKSFKSEFILACLQPPKSEVVKIAWAKEMKIMNALCKKCSDPLFWLHAKPEFKLPSLAWFLTQNGRSFLNQKFLRFTSNLRSDNKPVELGELDESENLTEIENPKPKIKTLKDFLKS
jgi:hypothetical protein